MTPLHTILLTGSNGLLGQKLLQKLRNRPAVKLIATSKGENRFPEADGYIYESLDITDFNALADIFARYQPTEVINSAAMTQVDDCEKQPELCEALNVTAVKHLCGLCKEYGARLLHVSTDFIFDGESGPYDETAAPAPLSVYGHSKWRAEQVVQSSGIPACIIRTVLVYGVVAGQSRSNIVLWVKKSLEAGKSISVVDDQVRSPTLAEDLADGILAALFRNRTGIYHISGSEILTVYEIALRVAQFWKLDTSLVSRTDSSTLSQLAKRPPRTGFIILKAQTELDYQPHSLEGGLALVDRQLREL